MESWLNTDQSIGEGAMNAERRKFRLKKQYGISKKSQKRPKIV